MRYILDFSDVGSLRVNRDVTKGGVDLGPLREYNAIAVANFHISVTGMEVRQDRKHTFY